MDNAKMGGTAKVTINDDYRPMQHFVCVGIFYSRAAM